MITDFQTLAALKWLPKTSDLIGCLFIEPRLSPADGAAGTGDSRKF